jgi:hypothetical protein
VLSCGVVGAWGTEERWCLGTHRDEASLDCCRYTLEPPCKGIGADEGAQVSSRLDVTGETDV